MKVQTDIIYDSVHNLKLDVYQPETATTLGIIFLIHGGGWFRGDKQKEDFLAEKLVAKNYTVVAPNYRLAPNTLYPGALDDVLQAFDWTVKSEFMAPSGKIFAMGASAGGNLSVELALQRGIPIASWSGIIDMVDWVEKHPDVVAQMNQEQHFDEAQSRNIDQSGANDQFYKWFILNYVNDDLKLLADATPLSRVSTKSGPMFLANSLHELVPTSGVKMLAAALEQVDVPSTVKLVAGTVHGEGYWESALDATLDFFAEYL